MTTECTTEQLEFGGLRRQRVVGRFDGGELGSDGGRRGSWRGAYRC